MGSNESRKRIRKGLEIAVLALLCALIVLMDFVDISIIKDEFRRRMLTKIIQQSVGSVVAVWCMLRFAIRLFHPMENWLHLLPCLVVAVNNLQWWAFFDGKMQLVRTEGVDILLFALSCLLTGLFEETVFRGILFSLLAGTFGKDRKGFLWTVTLSSVIFGLSHLFNGLSASVLLQVCYSVLTGGLFAFCLAKTKNVLCCALIHSVYNFCGLLFDLQGLGSGVAFGIGTMVMMTLIDVAVGIFVIYKLWTYPEEERKALYQKLNVKNKE